MAKNIALITGVTGQDGSYLSEFLLAKGYEVQYSTKSNYKSATKKIVAASKTSLSITKLKAKKKYYVRIRAYKTYTDANGKTAKAYGSWVKLNKKTK